MSETRHTAKQMRERIAALESIIRDTLWMARRYAHGRQTYAVGTYNDAARIAVRLGVSGHMPDGSAFALDGGDDGNGSPGFSSLNANEFEAAVAGLNAVGTTPHPGRLAKAKAQSPAPHQDREGR